MKALWHILLTTALISTLMVSCVKDRLERDCEDQVPTGCAVDSGKVNIRIYNFTKLPLCNFKLYNSLDTNNSSVFFGYIGKDSLSCYIPVDSSLVGAGFEYTVGAGEFTGEKTSAGFEKAPKTFITYRIYLGQLPDSVIEDGKLIRVDTVWKTFQTPIIDYY